MTTKKNPHRGSKFEGYLAEEGLLDAVNATATKRVKALRQSQEMRSVEVWKQKMLKDPAFKAEYDALEGEFALLRKRIAASAKRKKTARNRKA